ncbi:MAG: mevalonate kinase [Xanthomonadaceae bacterium]|nr:mevalonate kinase [Xanthomonadaceae bacterium]
MKEFTIPGKWILIGEHAVVRGKPAIAFPHEDKGLKFEWTEDLTQKKVVIQSPWNDALKSALGKLSQLIKLDLNLKLKGTLKVSGNLPARAGFGSSAALCVGLVRLCNELSFIRVNDSEARSLATELENIFHGTSSGLDIATVMSTKPIWFQKGAEPKPIELGGKFKFTFHDTETRSETRSTVARVQELTAQDPTRALQIDNRMEVATFHALQALLAGKPQALAQCMNQAQTCFDDWGLTQEAHKTQIEELKNQGALAVKYTGAGSGGFLVALWT